LYRLRRNRGLAQKHVATLLGYRGTSMISRFEHGTALPSLTMALLLERALGARLTEIYVDLIQSLERQLIKRVDRLPRHIGKNLRGRLLRKD
jgi:transcriptional regulator with XRE-family HTH domain